MKFKATDYLITPRDIFLLVRSFFNMKPTSWIKIAILAGVCIAGIYFGVGFINWLFFVYFLAVFFYDIDARISLMLACATLICIFVVMLLGPYTEFINNTTWPEPLSVWLYYFLLTGVCKQMMEMYAKKKKAEP